MIWGVGYIFSEWGETLKSSSKPLERRRLFWTLSTSFIPHLQHVSLHLLIVTNRIANTIMGRTLHINSFPQRFVTTLIQQFYNKNEHTNEVFFSHHLTKIFVTVINENKFGVNLIQYWKIPTIFKYSFIILFDEFSLG